VSPEFNTRFWKTLSKSTMEKIINDKLEVHHSLYPSPDDFMY
jgi:hypothetical protein